MSQASRLVLRTGESATGETRGHDDARRSLGALVPLGCRLCVQMCVHTAHHGAEQDVTKAGGETDLYA